MTLLGHGTFRCSRGAGNPPQTGARWAPPFSYAEDLSDGIGYLLDFPISPHPLKSAARRCHVNAIASRDSAAAQCKRGRSCERPRDGDDGSEGRFLYSQFPFIAFTAFILYSKEITQAEYDERKQTWDDGEDALEVLEQARRMDVAGIRE